MRPGLAVVLALLMPFWALAQVNTAQTAIKNVVNQAPGLIDFSPAETRLILRHGPWPPPPAQDVGNAQSGQPQAVALGQKLFFNPKLSADGRMSCASCHAPSKAFADGLARSLGRQPLDRNAPSLWNAVHERWHGWDGAADSIWGQSIRPLTDPLEMAASPEHIARSIAADPGLSCRYRQVFTEEPLSHSPQQALVNVSKAIGAFVASLVSGPTPFDRFRDALARGDTRQAARYPVEAQRGLRLFVGRGQCLVCHVGPMFSNGEFGDIGMPFFSRPGVVDSGRHGGIAALQASPYNRLSPFSTASFDAATQTRHIDPQHRNFGEFKVPSLRNVAATAPYMHDGQLPTLQAVVEHYSRMNPERLHADGEQILKPLALTEQESADLVAFLQSLTDPRVNQWKARPVPRCQ